MIFNSKLLMMGAILFLAIVILPSLISLWIDYLWFQDVGYASIFTKILLTKISTGLITFLVVSALSFLILKFTLKIKPKPTHNDNVIDIDMSSPSKKNNNKLILILSLGVGLVATLISVTALWENILLFLNQTPFESIDPIFNRDISFYFFTLPLLEVIYSLALFLLFGPAILTFIFSFYNQGFGMDPLKAIVKSLAYFISAFFILLAIAFQLQIINLLYSTRGSTYGAGFTDINITLPYLYIASAASIIAGIVFLIGIRKKNWRTTIIGPGLLLAVILVGNLAQILVQNFIVNPNELNQEREYITRNIQMTNASYGLDNITDIEFTVDNNLTYDDIEETRVTIDNIRINDFRPARTIFNQLQGMRLYYQFNDVDIDRYTIDGQQTQVFITSRELNQDLLPAKTWINKYLKYTHGYGVVVAPANEVTAQGQPAMKVKNIPPVSEVPELEITRPEIYFGEKTNDYIIVNTKEKEIDYPLGTDNAETVYEGTAGISLSGINRPLFALNQGNIRILISSIITGESKIIMHRNILDRVEKIAPFFTYDRDPYMVINQGKLYWMIDAYTLSNKYPYAQPIYFNSAGRSVNYIRNPIKVVVDAYNGDVDYYLVDESDPIANTYSNIFPDLFKPISQMPAGLREHIRYPVDLFDVQTRIFQDYHMENPNVFYNREDAWSIATETYSNNTEIINPYYVNMSLSSSNEVEYILMRPFTPIGRNNMVGWLAARNDGENYGELVLYRFSKQELVYGPMQIESRISSDGDIAREIALWDQRGSQVIRGNLLVIPIKNSILYVEPLYIQASNENSLPEVNRIIVAFQDKIVMERTLDEALIKLFRGVSGGTGTTIPETPGSGETEQSPTLDIDINVLARRVREAFERAQNASQSGNWAQYGEALQELETLITQLEDKTSQVD
ncbi:MAG: UPF0182 family protein [Clostridia bacterium]|nr:UPF0182 family protein [Clostridia bacterium]